MVRTLNQTLLAGNPQMKEEVELDVIFLVPTSSRVGTVYHLLLAWKWNS